ncbi:transcriptional regulator domain-containing protein [Comamonas aquatica]|uniref:transcriptional regulator domain-containing protein n=1 Tax=Comamonas aquatica TaxID=225991 RepID=UPI00244A157F|nr:DUF6499 domain-containing protein [Comamonas aquatica]MDH1379593.1 DUF6499 domain-containing protein [Comamonas aquatica]MDH1639503.1 DUF6499 domain-containing protein [Comamonas aquatica]
MTTNKPKKLFEKILSEPERKRRPAKVRLWEKDYPDYKLWNSQRWAWEFLRRNEEFISDCDLINNRNRSKQEQVICDKYGLSFFKNYDDKNAPYPEFINKVIEAWENEDKKDKKVEINLKHGQMLILFNVDQTLATSFELSAQIKSAREALEQYRDDLIFSSSKDLMDIEEPPKRRSSSPIHYVRHLKVIDSRNKGVPWARIAKLVFFEKIKNDEKIKGHPLTNIEITQKYYKTLVASLEKPKDYRSIAINTLKVGVVKSVLQNRIHKKELNKKIEKLKKAKAEKAASINKEAASEKAK